jgi:small subunit ribosomal protein S5
MPRINPEDLELQAGKLVQLKPVSKTVKGGRKRRFSALVVVGDGKGHVGVGMGKAAGVPDAIRKAEQTARRNLIHVPLASGTLPHPVLGRLGASRVVLKPAAPGTGVIAGTAVRAVLEASGVRDVLTKCIGSTNPVNVVYATIEGLRQIRRATQVAKVRGRSLDDLPIHPKIKEGILEYESSVASVESQTRPQPYRVAERPEGDSESAGAEAAESDGDTLEPSDYLGDGQEGQASH